jgi:hypothetical protein
MTNPEQAKSGTVANLEAAYGTPSQAGFGSAVFHEQLDATGVLRQMALVKHNYFVDGLWARFGAGARAGP